MADWHFIIWPKLTKINLNWLKLTQIYPNWPKLADINPNWLKLTKINLDWPKLIEIDPNWLKLTQIDWNWPKLIEIDPNWPKSTQIDKRGGQYASASALASGQVTTKPVRKHWHDDKKLESQCVSTGVRTRYYNEDETKSKWVIDWQLTDWLTIDWLTETDWGNRGTSNWESLIPCYIYILLLGTSSPIRYQRSDSLPFLPVNW